jgi:hypothetical protein
MIPLSVISGPHVRVRYTITRKPHSWGPWFCGCLWWHTLNHGLGLQLWGFFMGALWCGGVDGHAACDHRGLLQTSTLCHACVTRSGDAAGIESGTHHKASMSPFTGVQWGHNPARFSGVIPSGNHKQRGLNGGNMPKGAPRQPCAGEISDLQSATVPKLINTSDKLLFLNDFYRSSSG